MSKLYLPQDYKPILDPTETQRAIKRIKDHFQKELAHGLNLGRVSAPLFVFPETGLNDNLNGCLLNSRRCHGAVACDRSSPLHSKRSRACIAL